VSNVARHRDIAALLARGVIRVKKQPLVAKAIESHMAQGQSYRAPQSNGAAGTRVNEDVQDALASDDPVQHGGDQCAQK